MRLSYVPRVVFVSVFWCASICGAQIPTDPSEMYGAWCASCHALDGTGLVEIPTVTVEPMDFTDCPVTTSEPDADWKLVIAHGGPIAGHGQRGSRCTTSILASMKHLSPSR